MSNTANPPTARPGIILPAVGGRLHQARPAHARQKSGDVRGRHRLGAHHPAVRQGPRCTVGRRSRLQPADHRLAVVHRAVRQLRRGGRRGPRQGAGRRAAAVADQTQAKLLAGEGTSSYTLVPGTSLKLGDIVLVEAGDIIPSDGEVVEGVASVNEAAITGESAPVIRESGGDRSAVTGGTQVLSDWIRVRITAAPGSTFLDRMIAPRRRCRAPEDAERDRAQHPARRHDAHLRARGRDHPELRRLCRRRRCRSSCWWRCSSP